MILSSFTVENWGCVSRVEIAGLAPGINVIAAPNMSGKTTVAEALKLSLLDLKYNTSRIRRYIPWDAPEAVPSVTVEFTARGERFRMTKAFSRKTGGFSELARITDAGEQKIAGSGEVTDAVREILGMSGTNSGLPQLFWIPQGSITLPDVDEDLGRSLRAVLGQIHTSGQDLKVLELLRKNTAAWFKPADFKAGNFFENGDIAALRGKSLGANCPLKDMDERIAALEADLRDAESRLQQTDMLASELQQIRHEHSLTLAGIAQSENLLHHLREQEQGLAEKKRLIGELQHALDALGLERDRLTQALDAFRSLDREIDETGAELEAAREELKAADAFAARTRALHDQAMLNHAAAQDRRKAMARGRALMDAKKSVLHNTAESAQIRAALKKAQTLDAEIRQVRGRLAAIATPDARQSAAIRDLLQERETLGADLRAAELDVRIEAESSFSAELRLDDRDTGPAPVQPGAPVDVTVRREAAIRIPGIASVRIRRGRDTLGIDNLETSLEQNRASLHKFLGLLDISPDLSQTGILGQIESRISEKETLNSKLEELLRDRKAVISQSEDALAARLTQLQNHTASIVSAFPALADWTPDRAEIEAALPGLDADTAAADSACEAADAALRETSNAATAADTAMQALINKKTSISVRLGQKQKWRETEYGAKYGSADELGRLVEQKDREADAVREQLEHNALTDQEAGLNTRMEQEQAALDSRRARERSLNESRVRLETMLMNTEGLHAKRSAIEENLQAVRSARARLETSILAHCLLLTAMEQARDADVDKTLQPVTGKLNAWLGAMDGHRSKQVVFGPDLKPQGVNTRGGLMQDIAAATSLGEFEQLTLLIRMAYGCVAAGDKRQAVILDDPLAHTDRSRLMLLLPILEDAAARNLQFIIFTCDPSRFDYLRIKEFIPFQNQAT